MLTRSKAKALTPFDYDLNIFKREQMDAHGQYAHFGPWYIHIYMCACVCVYIQTYIHIRSERIY